MRRPEQQLHKAVALHLRERRADGVIWWHTPNGGARSPIEGAIFKSLGVLPGIPDIFALRGGQLYGLELKAEDGRLSKAQKACHALLMAAGAIVGVASSLDSALQQLESWGLLRGKTT